MEGDNELCGRGRRADKILTTKKLLDILAEVGTSEEPLKGDFPLTVNGLTIT